MSSINPDSIWVLSALDKLMADNKNKPQVFIALFQKKKTIVDLLQSMKIDSKKYKAIVAKAYKEDSGEVKKCAESDLLKCKDGKSDEMVELWFREMIQNTGATYQEQEKLYQKYQSAANTKSNIQKQEISGNTITKSNQPASSNQNIIDNLVSFKSIDDFLQKNENDKDYYSKLLQRKQKLLALVKSRALTAEKYKSTLETYIIKTANQDLKSDYKFELDGIEDFHNGNAAAWFKEIIEETNNKLQSQVQKLNSKPRPIQKSKPSQPKQNPIDKQTKQLQVQKSSTSKQAASFDINALTSFKIFDDLLSQLTANKQKYRELLNKKKKFLELVSKGALTAQKYQNLLVTAIKQAKNLQIKEGMEFQYSELQEFHDNNIQQWFKDLISSSELMLEDQEVILQKLEKGEKIKVQDDSDDIALSDDQDLVIDSDDEKNVKKQVKKQPIKPQQNKKSVIQQQSKSNKSGKLGMNPSTIYSLKALDQFMSEFQKDVQTFCICFQRKEAIFNLMKKGQITPEKYKQLQEVALKSTTNQKLKQVVEMDLFDLRDMCENNVIEWFQGLVNDAGFSYQEQQARYQKYKSSGPKKSQTKQLIKPIMSEVVCFTAVSLLFDDCQKTPDIVYYRELITKRERLLELVSQKKLISSKYRQINKATLSKTDNQFLRDVITDEEKLLSQKFNGKQDAWFLQIQKNISKNPPQLKLPENQEMKKVNSWPVDKKKKYLIFRMSVYQSLFRYYANNNLPSKNNKYILEYQKFKKQDAMKALQQLQKSPELDIYNIAQQLFPPITEHIFYGGSLSDQKQKVDKICQLFSKEIAAIKDYCGKIKKSTNPQNLQICNKQIAKYMQNIKYLKSWPNNQLVGFPRIKQQKVEKYNLDIIRQIDKNEIEIDVTNIQGINQYLTLKIFVANSQYPRFYAQVKSGPQNTIKTIAKLPNKDMLDIYKGEKKLIIFRLYQKGFFGGLSLVGENAVESNFIRNNIIEQRVQVGKVLLSYVLRVQKPSKPLITQITHYQMTTLPTFQNDPKVEQELIKKYMSAK